MVRVAVAAASPITRAKRLTISWFFVAYSVVVNQPVFEKRGAIASKNLREGADLAALEPAGQRRRVEVGAVDAAFLDRREAPPAPTSR